MPHINWGESRRQVEALQTQVFCQFTVSLEMQVSSAGAINFSHVSVFWPQIAKNVQHEWSWLFFYLGKTNTYPGTFCMLNSLLFSLLAYGTFRLSFSVETVIAPVAQVLVYTTSPSGEVIASSEDFQVEMCLPNKVSISHGFMQPMFILWTVAQFRFSEWRQNSQWVHKMFRLDVDWGLVTRISYKAMKIKSGARQKQKENLSSLLITLIKDQYALDTSRPQFTQLEVLE